MSKQIKFIPQHSRLKDLAPSQIVPSSKGVPDWWRKTRSTFGPQEVLFDGVATNFTVKKCVPFLDALTTGYLFVLQQDIIVMDHPNNPEIPFLDWKAKHITPVTEHSLEQIGEIEFSDSYARHVYKWHNDWEIRTPKGYSSAFGHPPNRFDLPFRTMDGVVDTDVYDGPVQFPFVVEKNFRGIIEAGTPIAHIRPIKRESWTSSYEDFDEVETDKKMFNFHKSIHSRYRNFYWFKKSFK